MELTTSNGVIMVQAAGGSGIVPHSSNGRIEIELPQGLNAELPARTSNGRIHSDMEVVTSRQGDSFLEGRIGSDGPRIDLQTSNGAIYLRRRPWARRA